MAERSTYFFDGESLATSTAVYLDSDLTTCAPDGFYSDGTIVREMSGCVLLPETSCPNCGGDCSSSPITYIGTRGIFNAGIDIGTSEGVVIVNFQFGYVPDGAIIEYDGEQYNELISEVYGLLAAPAGSPTYVGRQANDCGIAGTTQDLDVYQYNGTNYLFTGLTESTYISPNQVKTTFDAPANCYMVIPKPDPTPDSLDMKIIAPCEQASFSVRVLCPADLPAYDMIPTPLGTLGEACALASSGRIPFYHAVVNGSATSLGLYDMLFSNNTASPYQAAKVSSVFSIPSGETRFFRFFDGTYPFDAGQPNDGGAIVEVDSNGLVVSIQTCP